METFSMLLAICAGNSPVTGEFPAQRPVMRSFDIFFDLAWIHGWVNNGEAGDLRRHRAHYDVIVMPIITLRPGQDGCYFGTQHFQLQIGRWKCFNFNKKFHLSFCS